MKMEYLGFNHRSAIFSDGQETVSHFERLLNNLENGTLEGETLNATEHAI